jgi:Zn-dependent protease/CBS domain-containing protein
LLAGILFFASLLVHELSHALVARRFGIAVPRITLFLFGGAAEMESEPTTPAAELSVAIVGPVVSAVLGVAFTMLAMATGGPGFTEALASDPAKAMASLSPLGTVLHWLGPVNLVLAAFNMVPGFPLDGGRVLRAFIWWWTKDLRRATRIASEGGRLVGWGLMVLGGLSVLEGAAVQGLWLVLIGWFLSNIAQASYQQFLLQRAVGALRVRDLMRTRFDSVEASMPVQRFIDEYLLRSGQGTWPVREGDRCVGTVSLQQIADIPPERRGVLRLQEVMANLEDRSSVDADLAGRSALLRASAEGDEPIPVLEAGRLVGLLHRADILKWLRLHEVGH